MFAKSKVSQSLIDAVNSITSVDEAIKIPTTTGTKVLGRSYGNSAKAHLDQTKKDIDALKGPKSKDLVKQDKAEHEKTKGQYDEAAKPDFLDLDGDKNEKESMKKAIADKGNKGVKEELKSETFEFHLTEGSYADLHKKWGDTHNIEYHSHTLYPKHTVTKFDNEKDAESHAKKTGGTVRMSVSPKMKNEELKGNQDKIDANKNNKVDAHDFAILRGKKKVKEDYSFAARLIAHSKLAKEVQEEAYEPADSDVTTDTLKGREEGGKSNAFTSFKLKIKGSAPKTPGIEDSEKGMTARNPHVGNGGLVSIPPAGVVRKEEVELDEATPPKNTDIADKSYLKDMGKKPTVKSDLKNFGRFLAGKKETNEEAEKESCKDEVKKHEKRLHGKDGEVSKHVDKMHKEEVIDESKGLSPGQDDAPFDGPYTKTPSNVKDKSGAIHTPMSRAKDLARQAMKKVKTEMLGKAPGNNG